MHQPTQEQAQPVERYCMERGSNNYNKSEAETTLTWETKLTCNVEINKPGASTATYLPASFAVSKGVIICNNVRKIISKAHYFCNF